MACENLQSALNELLAERSSLQEELSDAPTNMKAGLVFQIKSLNSRIGLKKQELEICLAQVRQPTATPLNTSFSGSYTLSIMHPSIPGPIIDSVSAAVFFNASRTSVTMTALVLPPASFATPLGTNTTTVTLVGGGFGFFDKTTGSLGLTLPLFFDHSIDLPVYDEDSTLNMTLGTGTAGSLVGSPLDPTNGTITLVGSAVFSGGYLNGTRADLAIMGSFMVLP